MRSMLIRVGFVGVIGFLLAVSVAAQGRGARGEGAERGQRGGRGGNGELAEQRKAIQAKQQASIAAENMRFRTVMGAIQSSARNARDANAKAQAKTEADTERRNHQETLRQIRAQGAAAMAALRK